MKNILRNDFLLIFLSNLFIKIHYISPVTLLLNMMKNAFIPGVTDYANQYTGLNSKDVVYNLQQY